MKTLHYSDHECRVQLEELYNGNSVVVPVNEEHARYMIRVAQFYLDSKHQETFTTLKADYDHET